VEEIMSSGKRQLIELSMLVKLSGYYGRSKRTSERKANVIETCTVSDTAFPR
jgi:hypothetical protein